MIPPIDPTKRFTSRADDYASFRWEYAEAAIQAVCEIAQVGHSSRLADIGAGTGLLARRFAGQAGCVVAVEPNAAMRRWMQAGDEAALEIVAGSAEAIPLADQSVELITVGQALHWFQAEPARAEFRRILKPGGWLAVMGNHSTDPVYGEAMDTLRSATYGWDTSDENKGPGKPATYYLGETGYRKMEFPTSAGLSWESFFGGLCSHSHAPQEDNLLYPLFKEKCWEIFVRFNTGGELNIDYASMVTIGQME
jgi:SAM-dependent methyltransferase